MSDSSLKPIFYPKKIAVIGASSSPDSFGHKLIDNLMAVGFEGIIFPVNPRLQHVHSLKCYASVLDIPEPVDLAIITVPVDIVLDIIEQCGQKEVKGIILISAGFREETDSETGIKKAAILRTLLRIYNMRLIGPTSMGVFNNDPEVRLNASLAPDIPMDGNVGFISQSSALGMVVMEMAKKLNLGMAMFASLGRKADISTNDLLELYESHDAVKLIVMYIESLGNPHKFFQIARRVTRKKPIIIVKPAQNSPTSPQALPSSHTSVLAETELALNDLFNQSGVLRVSTIETMFKLATAFAHQPIPKNDRVIVLTNAEMPGILTAEALVARGLTLADIDPRTEKLLRNQFPELPANTNPVILPMKTNAEEYSDAFEALLYDDNVDAVIPIFVKHLKERSIDIARRISEVSSKFPDKTILSTLMGYEGIHASPDNQATGAKIPVYRFPESAVQALAAMKKFRDHRDKKTGKIREFEVDKTATRKLLRKVRQQERTLLTHEETIQILKAYGFQMATSQVVYNAQDAIQFARNLNKSIVLKLLSKDISRKTDAGGVKIDLRNQQEVKAAVEEILRNVEKRYPLAQINGFMAQEMIKGGKEIVLGMNQHPRFGPVIMFGLGGINVEVLRDVSFRAAPLSDADALEMINSLKSSPLLKGVDGSIPVNIGFIIENLQRLSQLITDFPVIKEVDINPFIVNHQPKECKIADARILLKKGDFHSI